MADSSTVARPYAKAIFEMARDKKALQNWDVVLKLLAYIAQDVEVIDFINNPSTTAEQQVDLFLSIVAKSKINFDQNGVANFLKALAENHRLLVLADVYLQYAQRRALYEKTIEVKVISYAPLTKSQEDKLIARLTTRLQREVTLNVEIDKSLKGGAIIRAGHLVFDASVGTQVNKLRGILAA